MSKLTNNLNLPKPIIKAIENSTYDPGESDITATGLIEPVQLHALKERYKDELVEDASNLLYSLQGQSIHTILERATEALTAEGFIAEKRFYTEVNGWKVGAQIDVFDTARGLLQDYKVTSVYQVKNGLKEEYAIQLNIGAELLRRAGHEVKALQIVAILRDWSKGQVERDEFGDYPKHQVAILDVPLIPREEVVAYLEARVREHQEASKKPDAELPPCSASERWAKDDKWAVMNGHAKRAVSVHSSEESANLYLQGSGKGTHVEKRPGVSTRCESYCPAKSVCPQYKKMKQGMN